LVAPTPQEGRVLVLEPASEQRELIVAALQATGFDVASVDAVADGIALSRKTVFDVTLVDLAGSNLSIRSLEELRNNGNPGALLAFTDSEAPEHSIEAMRLGAVSCPVKPDNPELAVEWTRYALAHSDLTHANAALRRMGSAPAEHQIVSKSAPMQRVARQMRQVAGSQAAVLIGGETGSGKGLVARTIHAWGSRSEEPFVHVNCAALSEQLLESELFGHERGAFTGAVAGKLGLFEVAHGGTIFLDEVGELQPPLQSKLLQVLDSGELRRVGGTRLRSVDARVISATKKNLRKEVSSDAFREDLYFRLNVMRIQVPPLRERREDIPELIQQFLDRFSARERTSRKMSRRAVQLLMEYHWPGNVRELINVLETVCLVAAGEVILPDDLPVHLQPYAPLESQAIDVPLPLAEMERLHILRALDYTEGKKAPAARLLGIDVKTLSNKVKAYKIEL
jgi:two-component system response regulator AtoC